MLSVKSNTNPSMARAGRVLAAATALVTIGFVSAAGAQAPGAETSVTRTGGFLVFPKIVVHTTGTGNPALAAGQLATDTVIQLTNTSADLITVNCYYVNANGHCGGAGPNARVCQSNSDCQGGQECVPGWNVRDFQFQMTPNQPLGWTASTGYDVLPCELTGCPDFQTGSEIPGVQENPFIGELKCYQVDPESPDEAPLAENNLKAEATIVQTNAPTGGAPPAVLAAAYNAVSFQAASEVAAGGPGPICLGDDTPPPGAVGTCSASFTPCPGTLMLQHFFEGAPTPDGFVSTELTLVPCSEDLSGDGTPPLTVTAQLLVYNEFEQRFSTNTRVQCFQNLRLSDIDTRRGPDGDPTSIFSFGVQGTLTGNTRIRGVQGAANGFGYGLLGVAHSYFAPALNASPDSAAAYHLNTSGQAAVTDVVYLP